VRSFSYLDPHIEHQINLGPRSAADNKGSRRLFRKGANSVRIPTFALLLAIAGLTPVQCLAQSRTIENKTGSAFGTVLMAMNHKPIDRAQVDIISSSTGWGTAILTNTDGEFDLTELPLGQYRLSVTAPHCERYEMIVNVEGRTGPLSLELTKAVRAAAPVNDSVVSVQELKMSGKAEPAFRKGTKLLQKGDARGSLEAISKPSVRRS
jgi:hypothetical protein